MSTMPRVDPGLVADGLTMEFSPKRPPDAVLLGCIVGALTFLFGVVKLTNSVNFLEMRLVGHRVGGRNATRSRWPIMLRLVTSLSFVTSCYMCVLLVMEEAGMLSQADQPPGWLGSFHTSRTVALSHGCRWSPWLRWFRFFLYVTSPPLRPTPSCSADPPALVVLLLSMLRSRRRVRFVSPVCMCAAVSLDCVGARVVGAGGG